MLFILEAVDLNISLWASYSYLFCGFFKSLQADAGIHWQVRNFLQYIYFNYCNSNRKYVGVSFFHIASLLFNTLSPVVNKLLCGLRKICFCLNGKPNMHLSLHFLVMTNWWPLESIFE
jgi:hypothetical protein